MKRPPDCFFRKTNSSRLFCFCFDVGVGAGSGTFSLTQNRYCVSGQTELLQKQDEWKKCISRPGGCAKNWIDHKKHRPGRAAIIIELTLGGGVGPTTTMMPTSHSFQPCSLKYVHLTVCLIQDNFRPRLITRRDCDHWRGHWRKRLTVDKTCK